MHSIHEKSRKKNVRGHPDPAVTKSYVSFGSATVTMQGHSGHAWTDRSNAILLGSLPYQLAILIKEVKAII